MKTGNLFPLAEFWEVIMVGKMWLRVFAFAILAISATARADQPWTFNNNTRYLAMGDSLTAGQGATPVTNGYAYLLYQQGVYDSVTNTSFADAAVPGATSQQILSFQVPLATQKGFPQVITMTVGGGLPTVYQGLFSVAREGLKVVPVFNMAQATLRRRSATDRKARPWL